VFSCALTVYFQFEPRSGPTGGGTLLVIAGQNFGTQQPLVLLGDSQRVCTPKNYSNDM